MCHQEENPLKKAAVIPAHILQRSPCSLTVICPRCLTAALTLVHVHHNQPNIKASPRKMSSCAEGTSQAVKGVESDIAAGTVAFLGGGGVPGFATSGGRASSHLSTCSLT